MSPDVKAELPPELGHKGFVFPVPSFKASSRSCVSFEAAEGITVQRHPELRSGSRAFLGGEPGLRERLDCLTPGGFLRRGRAADPSISEGS